MNRRTFLTTIPLVWGLPAMAAGSPLRTLFQQEGDEQICAQKFEIALAAGLQHEPIGDVVVEIGRSFLGTPYLAHALEVPGEERLVINMRGLDCVSFYENALVLARCIKMGTNTFEAYTDQLRLLRYRGGKIDGYASRLHYTSDYIYDNDKKGVWKDITKEIGGVPMKKVVNFMSTHPKAYRQIRDGKGVLEKIAAMEEAVNARTTYYIPKKNVESVVPRLRNGDILGFTTSMEGLDTSHTGILVKEHGRTQVLHAPLAGKQVVVSESSLPEYLKRNTKMTGIIVARPLEV